MIAANLQLHLRTNHRRLGLHFLLLLDHSALSMQGVTKAIQKAT
jgi:hypothetical protein